jgi:hypothetical protein
VPNWKSGITSTLAVLLIASCGGGGSSPPTYTLGGTVTGLTGSGLVLQLSNGNSVSVAAAGNFQFPMGLASGTAYSISVQTQPSSPAQTCAVNPASGTIAGGNVTNIAVSCTTNTYSVGGKVSGLVGTGLVLSDNGTDTLAVSANGTFQFASPLKSGATYGVAVQSQPGSRGLAETCSVTSGTGSVGAAAVNSVVVACSADAVQPAGTTLAISTGQTVSLFKVSPALAGTGGAPTPFQVIQTPNITGLAADPAGDIYYTANGGTAGSDASFYICAAPAAGQSYSCGVAPNTTTLPGGKLLRFDPYSGNLLAAQISATGTTIVEFPAALGPTASNQKTVYTSTGTPASVNVQPLGTGSNADLYVTEIPSGSTFGSGVKAFACLHPCAAGTQLDITQTLLTAAGTTAQLSGAMSSLNDFNNLVFGLANGYGANAAPSTLPIALQCSPQLTPPQLVYPYQFACGVGLNNSRSFPQSAANLSAFIGTAGLAVDSNLQLYAATALSTQGQTIDPTLLTGYSFTGYLSNSLSAFGCSSTPADCPVNLLPSVATGSGGNIPPYLIAMSANCQQIAANLTTYCGTFKIALTSPSTTSATSSSDTVVGMFWFTTMPITASYPGPPGPGSAVPGNCEVTILSGSTGPLTYSCDDSSSYTSSGSVSISGFNGQIGLKGTLSAGSVSGTATAMITMTGTGTFSGTAVSQ